MIRLLVILSVLVLAGCGTVTPDRVAPPAIASFDPQDQAEPTSGILGVDPAGVIITDAALTRYNALIADYGEEFQPQIRRGYGATALPDGTHRLNNAALERWLVMAEWRRLGRPAK